jgi:hypothetical protein
MSCTPRQSNHDGTWRQRRAWSTWGPSGLDEEAAQILGRANRLHAATHAEETDTDPDVWGWGA